MGNKGITQMIIFCTIILYLVTKLVAYKPVFLLHGVLTGNKSMEEISERIKELHPGTIVYNTDRFTGWSSLEPMWHQVLEFGKDLLNISQSHPEGIHFVGYSQGGLIGRVIMELYPNHSVHNFISLSSPQAGQYGTAFLHLFFPGMVCKTAYELFYSRVGQHTSVGNYWNDPYHQSFEDFKNGLLNLKNLVLIGGPDDGVITPWESSQFGYYNVNGTVVGLKDRDIYKRDLIGLKTLDNENKLHMITVPDVNHFQWHLNKTIIDKYILPYLD